MVWVVVEDVVLFVYDGGFFGCFFVELVFEGCGFVLLVVVDDFF